MDERRYEKVRQRCKEIVEEECEKFEIDEWSEFVSVAASLLFDARNQAFDSAMNILDKRELPELQTRNAIVKVVFTVLHRCCVDLEIDALQDVK